MNDVAATRMRAALRGRESVARWRLQTGAWGARVYAIVLSLPAFIGIVSHDQGSSATVYASLALAALTFGASFAVAKGHGWAAIAVFGSFFSTNSQPCAKSERPDFGTASVFL